MSLGIAAIDHVQLTVPKALETEALAFYRNVLGLKEIPKPEELRTRGGAWFVSEQIGEETLAQLLAEVDAAFREAAEQVRMLAGEDLNVARTVGRKQLPTSVGGALIHVADHTQRHVGQVVTTAKVLRALRA